MRPSLRCSTKGYNRRSQHLSRPRGTIFIMPTVRKLTLPTYVTTGDIRTFIQAWPAHTAPVQDQQPRLDHFSEGFRRPSCGSQEHSSTPSSIITLRSPVFGPVAITSCAQRFLFSTFLHAGSGSTNVMDNLLKTFRFSKDEQFSTKRPDVLAVALPQIKILLVLRLALPSHNFALTSLPC